MEEDNKIPEKLTGAGKKLPFTVPENYFDTFPQRLRDRMNEKQSVPALTRVVEFIRPRMSYAAVIAGIILVTFFGLRQIFLMNGPESIDNFELAEIVDFYLVEYDDALLYESVAELPEDEVANPLEENSDEILEYLTAEGIDYSLLIEEN